jgi:hypothetical protein
VTVLATSKPCPLVADPKFSPTAPICMLRDCLLSGESPFVVLRD